MTTLEAPTLEAPTLVAPADDTTDGVTQWVRPSLLTCRPTYGAVTSGDYTTVPSGAVTFGNDVTVPSEAVCEFEIEDTSSSATSSFLITGYTQPWKQAVVYHGWTNTTVIKKLKINISTYKNSWNTWGLNYATTTTTAFGNYATCYNTWSSDYVQTKEELFREKLKANLRPEIVTKNQQLWGVQLTEEEVRARTLLYDLVGDLDFRRYLRKGFIMVTGKSGTMYKISGGHNRIVSYKKAINGRLMPFEEFCVVFSQYNLPFTDGVIMRKLLVEHDEFSLRKKSNVFQVGEPGKFTIAPAPILRAG